MSLNRYEQTIFDYWERSPDERRHWQEKVVALTRNGVSLELARGLERELWEYLLERSENIPQVRNLGISRGSRISMLNLAEYVIRLWGPSPKPRKPAAPRL